MARRARVLHAVACEGCGRHFLTGEGVEPCAECGGDGFGVDASGEAQDERCPRCDGTGWTARRVAAALCLECTAVSWWVIR